MQAVCSFFSLGCELTAYAAPMAGEPPDLFERIVAVRGDGDRNRLAEDRRSPRRDSTIERREPPTECSFSLSPDLVLIPMHNACRESHDALSWVDPHQSPHSSAECQICASPGAEYGLDESDAVLLGVGDEVRCLLGKVGDEDVQTQLSLWLGEE